MEGWKLGLLANYFPSFICSLSSRSAPSSGNITIMTEPHAVQSISLINNNDEARAGRLATWQISAHNEDHFHHNHYGCLPWDGIESWVIFS